MLPLEQEADMTDERYLTVPEAAERLRMNPEVVRRWLRTGRLAGVRLGGTKLGWRVPERRVEALLAGKRAS
jgi:excisionase family DNA binding protein